jgi:hypothetical protein
MSRFFTLALLALALNITPCAAQDYCGLLQREGAVGLKPPPPSGSADAILKELSGVGTFNPATIRMQSSREPKLKARGAVAQMCNGNQRWVFYSDEFVDEIVSRGRSNWPKSLLSKTGQGCDVAC